MWALKEWAIAVDALLAGDFALLIRKGGIRERQPYFEVPSDRALLFPTYEHQAQAALRSPYCESWVPCPPPAVGTEVELPGWAEITHQWLLPGADARLIEALHPFHIWTASWLAERLAWQPERPAYGLLLRVHRFATPLPLRYERAHGGCRSWLALEVPHPLPDSTPVLTPQQYDRLARTIQGAIAPA